MTPDPAPQHWDTTTTRRYLLAIAQLVVEGQLRETETADSIVPLVASEFCDNRAAFSSLVASLRCGDDPEPALGVLLGVDEVGLRRGQKAHPAGKRVGA